MAARARTAPASCAGGSVERTTRSDGRLIAALAHRQVHLVAGLLLEREMADVADDADDAPLLRAPPEHVLANRILAGPQLSRHRLVDEHDRLARRPCRCGDVAAGAERNAHRRRIAVADDAHESRRELPRS